jgi:hypothetical protein
VLLPSWDGPNLRSPWGGSTRSWTRETSELLQFHNGVVPERRRGERLGT